MDKTLVEMIDEWLNDGKLVILYKNSAGVITATVYDKER